MGKIDAVLLNGPTGSGKTPFGDWLQVHGFRGKRCHHLDFGANLRAVAAGSLTGFSAEDTGFVRNLLDKGALLENGQFPLALRILRQFLSSRRFEPGDVLVMNGLPRHLSQAEALAPHLHFLCLVDLQCSADVVYQRLQHNSGGDREGRVDDAVALVEKKLRIFSERTRPVLDFYARLGVPVLPVRVGIDTQPPEIAALVEELASLWRLHGARPGFDA